MIRILFGTQPYAELLGVDSLEMNPACCVIYTERKKKKKKKKDESMLGRMEAINNEMFPQ